jgi:ankyrin repeat protein
MDRQRLGEMLARYPHFLTDRRVLDGAIAADRDDILALLLDLGVSPNVADIRGTAALHMAAAQGAEKCARLLIDRGADVDARESSYGGSPLTWAAHFGQQHMIELLGPHARDVWHLTYTGRFDRLRTLLREDPQRATVVNSDGHTPLMWLPDDASAAFRIAKLLLEHGADPSRLNDEGMTAADIAERRGMTEVGVLLRRHRKKA